MENQKLKTNEGFRCAKEITRKNAKSFYFASFFLGPIQRKYAYAVYAICRLSDDAVDKNEKKQRTSLEKIKNDIDLAYSPKDTESALLLAFRQTIKSAKIPKVYFNHLIQGMETDLVKNRYANFKELYAYCYKVAGVVGIIMAYLFGFKAEAAKKYAVSLGVAMQLTNILRDIKEDWEKERIYLPHNELRYFKISPNQIQKEIVNKDFIKLMRFQISRARAYYKKSEKGINLIAGWRCRLTVYLMKNIYSAILYEIEKNNYNIFNKRASTSHAAKVSISLLTIIKIQYL